MADIRQMLYSKTGIDPETLRLLDLYFGGQNRMPASMPRRTKKVKKPSFQLSPEQVVEAGGLPVEAGDIAMHFNNALASGAGTAAFEAIPPELRMDLLGLLMPAKKEKAKKTKLPKFDMLSRQPLSLEMQEKSGINKELAELLLQGDMTKVPLEDWPSLLLQYAEATGQLDAIRAEQEKTKPKGPQEKYYKISQGPKGKHYELAERPKGKGREMYGPTMLDQYRSRLSPDEIAKYTNIKQIAPTKTTQPSMGAPQSELANLSAFGGKLKSAAQPYFNIPEFFLSYLADLLGQVPTGTPGPTSIPGLGSYRPY